MKFVQLLMLLLICMTNAGFAEKTQALPEEISNPDTILVDAKRIVIGQGVHVFVIDRKSMQLERKIGKAGQGPNEFMKSPRPWIPSLIIHLKGKDLLINSIGKTALVGFDGIFIKEVKAPGFFGGFVPFGDKYVGFGRAMKEKISYITLSLYDNQFKNERLLYQVKSPQQRGGKVNPIVMGNFQHFFYQYSDEKRFYFPTDDGTIHVFDLNGKEVDSIKPAYTAVPLSGKLAATYDQFFKTDIRFKRIYTLDRQNVEFPKQLKPIKAHRVIDGKIYIITNNKNPKGYDSFIYSTEGKLLKRLPLQIMDRDILELYPFAIKDGKLFQLVENDDESYELQVSDIWK